jgi:hypothetical protein
MVRKNPQGLQPIQPTHEAVFRICGEHILFQTNSKLLMETAARVLDCLGEENGPHQPELRVQLFIQDAGIATELNDLDETTLPTFRMQEHLLTIALDKNNTAVIDLLQGYASGCLTEDILRGGEHISRIFIRTMALSMLPLAKGMLPIHASCVVRNGRGVIISGESGVGKSTLAMACIQHGFQLLADDAVFLRRDTSGLTLAGFPCEIRLYPESFPFLSPLDPQTGLKFANNKWKHYIDPGRQFPDSKVDLAEPGLVILLSRSDDHTEAEIHRLSKAEIDEGLEIAWPYHLDWSEASQANLDELLQIPGYRLSPGVDLTRAVRMLDQLLGEHF